MANFVLGSSSSNNNNKAKFWEDSSDDIQSPLVYSDELSAAASAGHSSFDLEGDLLTTETLSQTKKKLSNFEQQQQPSSLPATPVAGRHIFSKGPNARNAPFSGSSSSSSNYRRHYKKDSRFVLDLYTLTFDEDETLETCKTMTNNNSDTAEAMSGGEAHSMLVTMPSMSFSSNGGDSGPMSLGSNYSSSQQQKSKQQCYLPSLETNLHKILARKIQDSEEVSFRKAKLLTKAYYRLLRESPAPILDSKVCVMQQQLRESSGNKPIGADRISWQTLLKTDTTELSRTVRGLGNTVRALNEYLVELLLERDELLAVQDQRLEEISEMTDSLL